MKRYFTMATISLLGFWCINAAAQTLDWASLPFAASIEVGKKGETEVALFLDPNCPYCQQAQAGLSQNHDLHVYEFVESLLPGSEQKSKAIWCSRNRLQALNLAMSNIDIGNDTDCDTKALQTLQQYTRAHHLDATPVWVRRDGTMLWGYKPLPVISAWAKESSTIGVLSS